MKKSVSTPNRPSSNSGHTANAAGSVVTHLSASREGKKAVEKPVVDADFDFGALKTAIDELPIMDASKVVALHRRIVNGEYQIQTERVMEKLLEFESSIEPN